MKSVKQLVLLIVLSISVFACNENRVFKEYQSVSDLIWVKSEPKVFKVKIEDNSSPVNINIPIRHQSYIGYSALNLEILITSPSGDVSKTEYRYLLRDAENNLVGEALGDLCDTDAMVISNYVFNEKGEYTVTVSHNSEEEKILGIVEIGLFIDKLKK